MRWTKIVLRTTHLIGITGMGGLFFSAHQNYDYTPFLTLTCVTGLLFILIELWSNGIWLIQLRGITIYIKLFLFSFLFITPGFEKIIIVFLILISGLISHAPAYVRYYSIFHGRKISGSG